MVENMDGNGTPFHDGERELQERFGLQDKMEGVGRRVIRDHMPEEHQQFFELLPLLFLGLLDTDGHPRASVVTGTPGFVSSPDPRYLTVGAAALPGDPFAENLCAGAAIGLLGLEFHTRRRNRMNGTVVTADEVGFSVEVSQSYGNCPKYIQAREWRAAARPGGSPRVEQTDVMNDAMKSIVSSADTFFIASAYRPEDRSHPSHGVDVSHRRGPPGFVAIETDGSLSFPDYVGNFLFNTFGNLEKDPRAGLLFIDFETGDTLQLRGNARVLWDDPRTEGVPGAQRLVSFVPERAVRICSALGLGWHFIDQSPHIARLYEGVQRPDT